MVRLWETRTDSWAPHAAIAFPIPVSIGGHGGADPAIVSEFLRYVREGGATDTSPVAARHAVAAGCGATNSLRNGSVPVAIPPLPDEVVEFFA